MTEHMVTVNSEGSENAKWLENLKNAVVKFLMTEHDYQSEEAEQEVDASVLSEPDLWNENSDAAELAKYVASEDKEL